MKLWKLLIVIFLILIYSYSAWMTTVDDKSIWGWVCTLIFGALSLIGIYEFSHQKNHKEDENH